MTMLIVDDNAKMREMLKNLFRHEADEIYECADGNEVLESYTAHHPDWVLMDLKMPHVDGVTATRVIRHIYPDARIVIVTQYDDSVSRQEALNAGATAYVLKENAFLLPELVKTRTH